MDPAMQRRPDLNGWPTWGKSAPRLQQTAVVGGQAVGRPGQSQSTRSASTAYPTKATTSSSVCATTSGITLRVRV